MGAFDPVALERGSSRLERACAPAVGPCGGSVALATGETGAIACRSVWAATVRTACPRS